MIFGLVAVPTLVTFVGAVARPFLVQATGLDITWPLLLLGLSFLVVSLSGVLTPLDPDGCYAVERASEVKSVHSKLWLAWSTLAFLGLGAAMTSKDNSVSRIAVFFVPLVLILFAAHFFMLALGHPIMC